MRGGGEPRAAAGRECLGQHARGEVDHAVQVAGCGRRVRVVDRFRDVLGVHPALEGPVQHRVPQRQGEAAVRHRHGGGTPAGEGHRPHEGVGLFAPGAAHGAGGREVRARPERLGTPRRRVHGTGRPGSPGDPGRSAGPVRPVRPVLSVRLVRLVRRIRLIGFSRGFACGQRVVQSQREGHQAVHGEQVGDDSGDGGPAARGTLAAEPAKPHGRVPLGVTEVLEQGVEPRGLGVVGRRPDGYRDAGRPAAQAALDDAGAQARVEVEALRALEQADRLAQPAGLVRAGSAVAEVLLDRGRLLGRAGRQRPCPQQ